MASATDVWEALSAGVKRNDEEISRLKETSGHIAKLASFHTDMSKTLHKHAMSKLTSVLSDSQELPLDASALHLSDESFQSHITAPLDEYDPGSMTTTAVMAALTLDTCTWSIYHTDAAAALEDTAVTIATLVKVQAKASSELARAIARDKSELETRTSDVDAAFRSYEKESEAEAKAKEAVNAATGDPNIPPDKYTSLERKLEKATKKRVDAETLYEAAIAAYNSVKHTMLAIRKDERIKELAAMTSARSDLLARSATALTHSIYPTQPCPFDASRNRLAATAAFVNVDHDANCITNISGAHLLEPEDITKVIASITADKVGGTSIVHASFDFEHEFHELLGVSFHAEKTRRRKERARRWAARGVVSKYMPGSTDANDASQGSLLAPPGASSSAAAAKAAKRAKRKSFVLGNKPLPSLPPLPKTPDQTKHTQSPAQSPAQEPTPPQATTTSDSDIPDQDPPGSPPQTTVSAPSSPKSARPPKPTRRRSVQPVSAVPPSVRPPKPRRVSNPPKPRRISNPPNVAADLGPANHSPSKPRTVSDARPAKPPRVRTASTPQAPRLQPKPARSPARSLSRSSSPEPRSADQP